ncbi:MAG: hypothetical protein LBT76_03955 [Tannerella sp.]|jgi:outer membrane biosynthesis protein TonB|nr:hypothetical protein [Tannerella sp.]
MNALLDYIRGKRRGKAAHRIEREAMRDPFLAEALEGFDAVEGAHAERIAAMRRRLLSQTRRRYLRRRYVGAAASLLLCLLAGSYFLWNRSAADAFIGQSNKSLDMAFSSPPAPATDNEDGQETPPPARETSKKLSPAVPESAREIPAPKAAAEEPLTIASEDVQLEQAEAEYVSPEREAEAAFPDTPVLASQKRMSTARKEASPPPPAENDSTSSRHKPEPQTGMKAYRKYLQKSLVRPAEGACANVKGVVEIAFKIDTLGKPHDFVVKRSLCPEADREAIRLIEQGSRWKGDPSRTVTLKVRF